MCMLATESRVNADMSSIILSSHGLNNLTHGRRLFMIDLDPGLQCPQGLFETQASQPWPASA
jgi:O-succinylbenzoate synthase